MMWSLVISFACALHSFSYESSLWSGMETQVQVGHGVATAEGLWELLLPEEKFG